MLSVHLFVFPIPVRKGRCERTTRLCRDEEDVWVEECRRGYRCDSNQYCARSRSAGIGGDFFDEDRRDDGFCSVARPCPIGQYMIRIHTHGLMLYLRYYVHRYNSSMNLF